MISQTGRPGRVALAAAVALALSTSGVHANILSIVFTAEITDIDKMSDGDGRLAGLTIGQTITGSYQLDTNTPASLLTSTRAEYDGAPIVFTVDGFTTLSSTSDNTLSIFDGFDSQGELVDFYGVRVNGSDPNDAEMFSIGGFGSTDLDAITGLAPMTLPDLAHYGPSPLQVRYDYSDLTDSDFGGFRARLLSIVVEGQEVGDIPEPGTLAILSAGLVLLAMRKHRRR